MSPSSELRRCRRGSDQSPESCDTAGSGDAARDGDDGRDGTAEGRSGRGTAKGRRREGLCGSERWMDAAVRTGTVFANLRYRVG